MRHLLAALLLTVAAGCASVSPTVPAVALPYASWTLQGRIGVQAGEQSLSGNIRWQHRAEADEVLLISPLGQGVARIVRNAEGVTLEAPNRSPRRAPDAESLTREALGYALPVAGLAYGWVIDYLQYAADARPRKLVVAREGLEIRLVADNWQTE
ncbi:MAG: outer membrane lipoprotein LolB [Thiobacillus sp. SCN 63-374]|nr:MAG: outer membrane lipoprotein LolB [Thiobacillus sp. SCN 63-374]